MADFDELILITVMKQWNITFLYWKPCLSIIVWFSWYQIKIYRYIHEDFNASQRKFHDFVVEFYLMQIIFQNGFSHVCKVFLTFKKLVNLKLKSYLICYWMLFYHIIVNLHIWINMCMDVKTLSSKCTLFVGQPTVFVRAD